MEAGEIRGISIRLLETFPDHPGMLLLRGVTETLVQKRDDLLVRNSIISSLENAQSRYDCTKEELNDLLKQLISFAGTRAPNLRIPLISSIRNVRKNNDIIDEEITDILSAESNAWDKNSRAVIVATEFEAKLPVMLTLARQKFEHHLNYLNK